ncbi:SCO1/SenC family protein [Rickettsia endosymbiont of Ixodes pacificus]|nr:SCO1/SenC family protein [Rickettsia endosymbiont of Ixodes pacificus]
MKKENILVQVVFIALDPEHDTSEVLKKYLEKIDVNFIGLTGGVQDIEQLANQFKVFYTSKIFDVKTNEYELQHSNFVYLISSQGKFLKHYCLGLPKNG